MIHIRTSNNKINRTHKKALRLVYRNQIILLEKNETMNIHLKNLQILATETDKEKSDPARDIMKDMFAFVEKRFNLRTNQL